MSHDHHHHHDHEHEKSPMTTKEKLVKLMDHWIAHNQDHAKTYKTWAARAREEGLDNVADLLEQAGSMNLSINEIFHKAADKLK